MTRLLEMGYRAARRVVVAVVGGTLVLIGLALLVLPGPALLVLPVGLAVLGLEFAWARRWLRKVKEAADRATRYLPGNHRSARRDTDSEPEHARGSPPPPGR